MRKPIWPWPDAVAVLVILALLGARFFLFEEFWSAYDWTANVGIAAIVFSIGAAFNLSIAHWYRERMWNWIQAHEPGIKVPPTFDERVRQILSVLLCCACLYSAFAPTGAEVPAEKEKRILWQDDPNEVDRTWYTLEEFKEIEYQLDPELVHPPKFKPWHYSLKYNAFAAFAGLCGLLYAVNLALEPKALLDEKNRPSDDGEDDE